jgi:hypothetical protein
LIQRDRRSFHQAVEARGDRRLHHFPDELEGHTVGFTQPHRLQRTSFQWEDLLGLPATAAGLASRPIHAALVAPYDHFAVDVYELDGVQQAIAEALPPNRELALDKLARRTGRRAPEEIWRSSLERLVALGLVGVYRAAG